MIDITHKSSTYRIAKAEAILKVGEQATIDAVVNKQVAKGDVFEMSKTAGLFAVKKTAEMIPDCHPMPVEYTKVNFEVNDFTIRIVMDVATIYKTGVEVEAMHGVSVVALTMYDMLKPIDKQIEIQNIRLVEKKGGKSDFKDKHLSDLTAQVVVCSDTVSAGQKEDKAGKAICSELEKMGVEKIGYKVIPDEATQIESTLNSAVSEGIRLIIYTGGTGLSPRDVTPETIEPLLDRRIPGIEETIRNYGQQRTPYAMLSRSIVGTIKGSLIMALPGSTKGAIESIKAVFPASLHLFKIIGGGRHD